MTRNVIEVFYKNHRIASHRRLQGRPDQYSTVEAHMPEDHQKYIQWNADRFIKWAETIGPNTVVPIKAILASRKVEQQSYRSCLGLLKLADKYSAERVEAACKKALSYTPSPNFKASRPSSLQVRIRWMKRTPPPLNIPPLSTGLPVEPITTGGLATMINETTINKMRDMRLTTMAESFRRQMTDSSLTNLAFEERIGMLVDAEWTSRKNNHLKKLIKSAGFDQTNACIADVDYRPARKLDQAQILRLADCTYIKEKHNIIIMGATGSGKSYMACAFGIAACQNFHTVKYIRLPDLLIELDIARNEGSYKKLMNQYRKAHLLILDEWMLVSLKENEARDVLEIIHARHHKGSTVFCSQFSPAGWHSKIGEETIADAILDRIVHDSYMIEINVNSDEDSMRELYGIRRNKQE